MAESGSVAPALNQSTSDQTRGGHPARRGNRRGGSNGPQPARDSRSRSSRRGGRGGANKSRNDPNEAARQPRPAQHSNAATTSSLTAHASLPSTNDSGHAVIERNEQGTDDVEADVCFICASNVVHQSVAPCNHRTCHICALRLRALYKTRACAHCRTESPFVIFTDDAEKRYEDFQDDDFESVDDALGIKYENQDIHGDTILLLRYNCPEPSCDIACYGWPDLHRHVKSVHQKVMCDLCTRNKKVFTHEHELFTHQELRKHEKFGDDNPGAVDQSGFKGHPDCGFCRRRFYGDDELFVHCREKHERCHICDRRNSGRSHQYYVDYNSLEAHFRKDHFQCMDKECLEKKFVVFESELDLKAHQLEAHPNSMSKDVRREARTVNMASFDYRAPHQEERRGGRGGRGRGRDPNADVSAPPSTQQLTRGEIAFQRQMAIQSAQSVTTRTFGGELTSSTRRPNPQPPLATSSSPTVQGDSSSLVAPVNGLSLRSRSSSPGRQVAASQVPDPREESRRLQHQSVMNRAAAMLHNDASKLESFRSRVSSYKASSITATEMIDAFFSLFDDSSGDLGKLIKELAELYESESKRADLLKAWNDWRAINEDYPSLPGPSGTAQASSAGSGGRRILRLKSSTAPSNRSTANQQMGWGGLPKFGGTAAAGSSASWSSNPFPSLPPANRASAAAGAVPWITNSTNLSRTSQGGTSSPARRTPAAASAPLAGRDAFPALPKAAKPNTHIFGKHHAAVRWDDGRGMGPPTNAWDSARKGDDASNPASEAEGEAPGTSSKKKGKKGKEVLYKFG